MPQAFGHLMEEEKTEEKEKEALISAKADIEALKIRFEEFESATCQLSEESESIKGLRSLESFAQSFLENSFKEFVEDPKKATKERLESCGTVISLIDRYRHVKAQLELLKHVKFSTVPVKQ